MAAQQPITEKGLKYNAEDAKAAAAQGKFIRVRSNQGGQTSNGPTKRSLSGAERMWKRAENAAEDEKRALRPDERDVYIISLRLAGTPADITRALRAANYGENDIRRYLSEAVTQENFKRLSSGQPNRGEESLASAVRAELESSSRLSGSKGGSSKQYGQYSLRDFVNMAGGTIKAVSSGGTRASPRGGGGARKTLAERIEKLKREGDKVMNVSELKADGTGAKAIPRPSGKRAPTKMVIEKYRIASDNLDGLREALRQLGASASEIEHAAGSFGPSGKFEKAVTAPKAAKGGKAKGGKAKGGKGKKAKSPRGKSPAAAAAPSVSSATGDVKSAAPAPQGMMSSAAAAPFVPPSFAGPSGGFGSVGRPLSPRGQGQFTAAPTSQARVYTPPSGAPQGYGTTAAAVPSMPQTGLF